MIYFKLISEFLKIGLFSFGGGYATIPFLYHISTQYNWYSLEELTQMTAIASITPGPIGINIATYAGLKTAGIFGSILATLSEMLPSLLLVIIVSKLLKKFSNNFYVKTIIKTLKPISCALLVSVALGLFESEIKTLPSVILLSILILISWNGKKDPIFYILISGIVGIILAFLQTSFSFSY